MTDQSPSGLPLFTIGSPVGDSLVNKTAKQPVTRYRKKVPLSGKERVRRARARARSRRDFVLSQYLTPAALDDRLAVIARRPGARFLGMTLAQWAYERKTPWKLVVMFGMADAVVQSRHDNLEKRMKTKLRKVSAAELLQQQAALPSGRSGVE